MKKAKGQESRSVAKYESTAKEIGNLAVQLTELSELPEVKAHVEEKLSAENEREAKEAPEPEAVEIEEGEETRDPHWRCLNYEENDRACELAFSVKAAVRLVSQECFRIGETREDVMDCYHLLDNAETQMRELIGIILG